MARAPGVIRRRGRGWNVMIRLNGERYQYGPRTESVLRDGTRNQVEEWVWRKYRELEANAKRQRRGLPSAVPFSGLADEYERLELPALRSENTRANYRESLGRLRSYFVDALNDPNLEEIGRREVRQFIRWRGRQKRRGGGTVAVRTVAKDFRVLRRLFSWAVEMEYLEASPAAGVKEPKADERPIDILDAGQYEALISAAGERDAFRLWLLVLGEAGVRAYSEALHLKWSDVDLSDGFLHVVSGRDGHRTKAGKSRYVPMTPRLLEAMKAYFAAYRFRRYEGRPTEWIFHHRRTRKRGKRQQQAGARIESFKGPFATAKRKAKLPETFRPHDLRHRRCTTWLAEGQPIALVSKAMGHSSIAVTEKYLHLVREDLKLLVQEHDRQALRGLAT